VFYNYTSSMTTLIANVYLDDEAKIVISDDKIENNETNFNNELEDFI